MASGNDKACWFCRRGTCRDVFSQVRFRQRTDRGYIYCDVSVPVEACDGCGVRQWSAAAEVMIEEAVRSEYGRIEHGTMESELPGGALHSVKERQPDALL
jgi:hypothetical protein